MHACALLLDDEAHVEENRALYREKFEAADRILAGRYGYTRPQGGFFLWLDVSRFGGSEEAVKTLWKGCGVKLLPGRYLARDEADGTNPGADFVRVAMVDDLATTQEALERIVATLK
jgi:aspartate/methionine/tyrosine aminotransferase